MSTKKFGYEKFQLLMILLVFLLIIFTISTSVAFAKYGAKISIPASLLTSLASPSSSNNEVIRKFKGFGRKLQPIKNNDRNETNNSNSVLLPNSNSTIEERILKSDMFKQTTLRAIRDLEEKKRRLEEMEDQHTDHDDSSIGYVPDTIANRMMQRIGVFFGVPVFGGLSIFVGAFFYSKKFDVTLPPVVIAYATQIPFVFGLLGITYGIISSSWDVVSSTLV